ncbi:hypothetical protein ACE1MS_22875 (plasmid) [Lysinibacillus sp. fkY74-1]
MSENTGQLLLFDFEEAVEVIDNATLLGVSPFPRLLSHHLLIR